MRLGFGLVGLLLALAIVAVLAKRQMGATRAAVPPAVQEQPVPTDGAAPTVRAQGQQVQQQVRQQVEALMQQPRPVPDESQ